MSSSYLSISSATAVRTPARDSDDWDAANSNGGIQSGLIPGLLRNGQGADCGLDRVGKPGDLRRSGHSKAHVPSESQNTTFFRRFVRGEKIPGMRIWSYKGTACLVNQAVSSSSLREPSARWRKVKYISSFGGHDVPAISVQKRQGNDQGGALIAVDKRMISGDSEGI